MLKKLLKYDWQATGPYLLIGDVVYLAMSAGFALLLHGSLNGTMLSLPLTMVLLAGVLWGLSAAGVVLMNYIVLTRRFYRNMVTDQGYLTLTLPVSTGKKVLSKFINAMVCVLITGLVMNLGLVLVAAGLKEGPFWSGVPFLVERLWQSISAEWTWPLVISLLLKIPQEILLIYFSICLGQLCKEHKIWGSVGVYFGVKAAFNVLAWIFVVMAGHTESNLWMWGSGLASLGISVGIPVGLCLLYFLGSVRLLDRHANLE